MHFSQLDMSAREEEKHREAKAQASHRHTSRPSHGDGSVAYRRCHQGRGCGGIVASQLAKEMAKFRKHANLGLAQESAV